jgi:hypothetical protein
MVHSWLYHSVGQELPTRHGRLAPDQQRCRTTDQEEPEAGLTAAASAFGTAAST